MSNRTLMRLSCTLAALLPLAGSVAARGADADGDEFFEKRVRPILTRHCHQCHSAGKKAKGGLRLDTRAALLAGGESGPSVVPGAPEKSRLIAAIRYGNTDLQMPPKGKLADTAVADLTEWVRRAAPWPSSASGAKPASVDGGFDLQKRKNEHWAWRPIRTGVPPVVRGASWARDDSDRFVLARLEEKGLRPAPDADKRTLFRRVTFDLTGLPPAPEQVDAFVADQSPDAYEKTVDRLLASPAYGERWARHWLDLVRYAESRGHEQDYTIPNAYQYRDYVIRALNADVPYDRFVKEHLAGDLLPEPRRHPTEGSNESILGTGFWFLGEEVHSPVDTRQDQADRFDNRIDVLTKAFLGLTVSCARCHDHKFDAISTRDYYALFGILEGSCYRQVRFDTLEQDRRTAARLARHRDEGGRSVRGSLAAASAASHARTESYLLASREAILGAGEVPPGRPVKPEPSGEAYRERLSTIARSRSLDTDRLKQWVVAVLNAVGDSRDPLHPWAVAAGDPRAANPNGFADVLRHLAADLRKTDGNLRGAARGVEIVADYASTAPPPWLPDGSAFGTGPVRPGDVRRAEGFVRLVDRAAAEYDRFWDGLKPVAGSENDPGALGPLVRAGRTLCTQSFSLSTGKLFYLVRGAGRAYAAVDAHTMIAGPLHGQLVLSIPEAAGFRWVGHDLTPYKGHRTHIEFTPTSGSDFAVATVVQADRPPLLPDCPSRYLSRLLRAGGPDTPETVAAAYARMFEDATRRLAALSPGSPAITDDARIGDWLLHHRELLGEGAKTVAGAAELFVEEEKKQAAGVRFESRLAPASLEGNGVDESVFVRGSPKGLGEQVPRRFLEALAGPGPLAPRGSGRLELARQMTDPVLDPFLPRVLVNRVWHHLFGRGIVASVDNFGVLGDAPSHPELLDFLADRFVREGWSLKKLVRELVLSRTYRMSSRPDPDADRADPQDLLLHRMRLRRLEGEVVRDAILAVSGRLDRKPYGPPVPIHLTPFLDGRGRPGDGPLDGAGRRSLYLAVRRNFLSPLLLAFDTPIPFSTVGRRSVSNVPAQALILMNDPFVHRQAELWAKRVLATPGQPAGRIEGMYLRAFSRPPTPEERDACVAFLQAQARLHRTSADDPKPWADLAHTLFNTKDFIYLD